MPPGFPDALRRAAKRFLNEYRSQMQPFETEYEVAPGVLVHRTGGHTPGHSVVRLASGGDRLTFAGDAVFQVGFEHPDWFNGFEHDPEEAARVRVDLLRELAANRESLVATHLSFPSVCHVAVDGDVFRWVPGPWEYLTACLARAVSFPCSAKASAERPAARLKASRYAVVESGLSAKTPGCAQNERCHITTCCPVLASTSTLRPVSRETRRRR